VKSHSISINTVLVAIQNYCVEETWIDSYLS
jgi:hypothetical protein